MYETHKSTASAASLSLFHIYKYDCIFLFIPSYLFYNHTISLILKCKDLHFNICDLGLHTIILL